MGTLALNGVCAGAIERLAGREIRVDLRPSQSPEVNRRRANDALHERAPGSQQRDAREHRVRPSGEGGQHRDCVVGIARLAECSRVERDDGVGGEDPRIRTTRGDLTRLLVRHPLREHVGRFIVVRDLVDVGSDHVERASQLLEQPTSTRRRRREHEWRQHRVVVPKGFGGVKHARPIAQVRIARYPKAMRRFVLGAVGVAVLAFVAGTGCLHAASRRSSSPSAHAAVSASARDTRRTFVDAVTRYERGELASAGAAFRTLIDSYPALGDYHLAYLAAIADRSGQPAEAAAWDDRLLSMHPESVWVPTALARHARIAAALGDPRAEELATRARDAGAQDPNARGWGLVVLAGLRAPTRPREAYELYQEARRVGGEAARVARDGCRELAARHPELADDPALALAEGRLLVTENDTEGAIARFRDAAERGTGADRVEALRALAKALQSSGRLEDALATYRSAVAAGPTASLARFELATVLWNRDRDAEAKTLFTEILVESPRHPKYETAQYALARIAEGDGRTDEAVVLYRRLAAEGGESDLARDARWRLAWIPYQQGDLAAADAGFAALGAGSAKDRAAGFYWRARVAARRHDTDGERALLAEVLRESPDAYYADLAERELGTSAPPPDPPTPLALREPPPSVAMHHYHWSRTVELGAIGMEAAAARELLALTRELPDDGTHEPYLLQAYTDVGATTRALRLAIRFSASDIPAATLAAYQYPRVYWEQVRSAADAERLDPYAVLALMRQESLFDPNAVSPAAAYGLMQLLVPTASRVAGYPVERASLFEPTTNIALGTRYLRQLLDRYDGDLAKALAAYNGGEEAVAKWERRAPGAPTDEFVETISYRETRHYVKTVLGNYRRYRRLYGAPGEERARERAAYDAAGSPSAVTSLEPSPPNPPFDIITTTSPDAT